MPQHKGFEPFFYIWVIHLVRRYKGSLSTNYDCADSRCIFFIDEQSYIDWKAMVAAQKSSDPVHFEIRDDYGKQKWWNDKFWINFQLSNVYVNGNFLPNTSPAQLG